MQRNKRKNRIHEALSILRELGMPRMQQNERSALCLLSLADVSPETAWAGGTAPLMGITPIMDWIKRNYRKNYAPNTRETVRRQTMHQFVQAGIALYNPDQQNRPVNSPNAVYQIEPGCLDVLRTFGTPEYPVLLAAYITKRGTLASKYAMQRKMEMVPIITTSDRKISLSPGEHSELIKSIVQEFGPRFIPGGRLVYVGDTEHKWGHFDDGLPANIGVEIGNHGKMPDVIIYDPKKKWLALVEAVTSHGPVDSKRHEELQQLFESAKAGLVFVSAFPNRKVFSKYQEVISWETEAWVADNPSHLIHFNGIRFFGPY